MTATHTAHVTLADGTIHRVDVSGDDRRAAARAAAAMFPGRVQRVSCRSIDQGARVLEALELRVGPLSLLQPRGHA